MNPVVFFFLSISLVTSILADETKQIISAEAVPGGLTKGDWQGIRAAYDAGRHAFQATEGGWQARNTGQQWLTFFDQRGFTAQPQSGGWQWGLELQSYGIGGDQHIIDSRPVVSAEGQRLRYQWDGNVQEWFVNDASGLEHGFTVAQRPTGMSAGGEPLAFHLSVRGDLHPHLTADELGVDFRNADGSTALHYHGLKVWDADGKALPSRFELCAGRTAEHSSSFRLLVDERGARYPLTIDPTAQQAYLKASNTGTNDQFGFSVAISGDTVVIGAPAEKSNATGVNGNQADNSNTNAGAVYVFTRSNGTWSQQAYLKASNTESADYFGWSVAISGETITVGAFGENSNATGVNGSQTGNSASFSGAAYVFSRSGTTWTQQAYLKASNTGANDQFGRSVAVSGDVVVVGAPFEDSSTTGVNGIQASEAAADSGAAYVFRRSGTTWSQQAYLKASNTGAGDWFGYSVTASGDTVVIGAASEASNATGVNGNQANDTATQAGASYVFTYGGSAWTQQAYLKASNAGGGDQFGYAVALSADTLVVGAYGEDSSATGVNGNQTDNSNPAAGAAYVFTRSAGDWSQQAYLKASNSAAADAFGSSVAVAGDLVVVGAYAEAGNASGVNGNQSDNSAATSGAAYAFTRSGTAWSQLAYLKASNPGAGDQFGYAVAASEGTAIIGAPYEDSSSTGVNGSQTSESATQAGAAYVFTDFVSLIPTVAAVSPDSGRTVGGTLVTIIGTNFTGASQVTFGGTPATDVTVINATRLTCITPPGNDGTASVIVTTPYGSNAENTLFTYQNIAPDITVTQVDGLVDGEGSVPFTAIIGSTETLTFTITNSGTEPLTNLALSKEGMNAGDFTVSGLSGTSIPVGSGTATFTVKFSPTIGGPKNAVLHITSNVSGAKSSFDIALLGQALSHSQDSDGDGLNDASEYEMAVMGFDWRISQTALVNTYYSSANGAGLYTPSQVQTLHIGTPLLQRDSTTGNFTLTIGVEKSSTLLPGSFSPLPLTAPQTTINGAGKLEFQFPSTDRAAFYRLQVD